MVDVSKMIRTFLPGGESLLEWRCMSVSVTASEHGTNMCLEPKLMETELYLDLILYCRQFLPHGPTSHTAARPDNVNEVT